MTATIERTAIDIDQARARLCVDILRRPEQHHALEGYVMNNLWNPWAESFEVTRAAIKHYAPLGNEVLSGVRNAITAHDMWEGVGYGRFRLRPDYQESLLNRSNSEPLLPTLGDEPVLKPTGTSTTHNGFRFGATPGDANRYRHLTDSERVTASGVCHQDQLLLFIASSPIHSPAAYALMCRVGQDFDLDTGEADVHKDDLAAVSGLVAKALHNQVKAVNAQGWWRWHRGGNRDRFTLTPDGAANLAAFAAWMF